MDFNKFALKKFDYRIKKANICTDKKPENKFCNRSKKNSEMRRNRYQQRLQKITNILANFEIELNKLLTDKQKELRKTHEEENNIERKINIDLRYSDLLESEFEKIVERKERSENIIMNLERLLNRVKNDRRINKIKSIIQKHEKSVDMYKEIMDMIESEMEGLFGAAHIKSSIHKIKNKYLKSYN